MFGLFSSERSVGVAFAGWFVVYFASSATLLTRHRSPTQSQKHFHFHRSPTVWQAALCKDSVYASNHLASGLSGCSCRTSDLAHYRWRCQVRAPLGRLRGRDRPRRRRGGRRYAVSEEAVGYHFRRLLRLDRWDFLNLCGQYRLDAADARQSPRGTYSLGSGNGLVLRLCQPADADQGRFPVCDPVHRICQRGQGTPTLLVGYQRRY
jgi:hypothetical protein